MSCGSTPGGVRLTTSSTDARRDPLGRPGEGIEGGDDRAGAALLRLRSDRRARHLLAVTATGKRSNRDEHGDQTH